MLYTMCFCAPKCDPHAPPLIRGDCVNWSIPSSSLSTGSLVGKRSLSPPVPH